MVARRLAPLLVATLAACGSSAPSSRAEPASSPVHIAEAAPHTAVSPPRPVPAASVEPEPEPEPPPSAAVTEGELRALVERSTWRERLHWGAECEDDGFQPSDGDPGVEATELGRGKMLVRVLCQRAAYNLTVSWFWVDSSRTPERVVGLSFPTYEVPDEKTTRPITSTLLRGLDELDVRRREITVWRKFRGIGDCGLSARYAVDGGKVRVLDIRAKLACDGEPAEGASMKRLGVPKVRLVAARSRIPGLRVATHDAALAIAARAVGFSLVALPASRLIVLVPKPGRCGHLRW